MSRSSLIIDAWTREAEEASQWVEDLESRVKNSDSEQLSPAHSARSKLKELCVKLDRLESLLRNPPSKPVLTDEDLNYRWTMLSDVQQRTRAVARNLYAIPSKNRKRSIPTKAAEELGSSDFSEQDTDENLSRKDESELLMPLLRSEDPNESDDRVWFFFVQRLDLQRLNWTSLVSTMLQLLKRKHDHRYHVPLSNMDLLNSLSALLSSSDLANRERWKASFVGASLLISLELESWQGVEAWIEESIREVYNRGHC